MVAGLERERRDMGITHADFRRIFPRLLADAASAEIGLLSRVRWADGRDLTVEVSPELERRIATLRMPYVHIRFIFQGFADDDADAFLARFDRAFHKGGG